MGKINIQNPLNPNLFTSQDNMTLGVDYAFYLYNIKNKSAPTYYFRLISSAMDNIIIWDPFFLHDDTMIFSYLQHPVKVQVLTKKYAKIKDSYLNELISKTRNNINLSVKGNCDFFFGFIDTDSHGDLWQCHDRFLIIDDIHYFLIGASVASHRLARHSTGIYEVRNPYDQKIIEDAFNKTKSICKKDATYKEIKI